MFFRAFASEEGDPPSSLATLLTSSTNSKKANIFTIEKEPI